MSYPQQLWQQSAVEHNLTQRNHLYWVMNVYIIDIFLLMLLEFVSTMVWMKEKGQMMYLFYQKRDII